MTKQRKQHELTPFDGNIRVLTTLLEHPDYGATEDQIAAVNNMSVRNEHRAVVILAMNGIVKLHVSTAGDRVTLNFHHKLLDPLLELLSGSIAAAANGLTEMLKLKDGTVSIAVDWNTDVGQPANILATVPNGTPDERIFELGAQLEHEFDRYLLRPRVKVRTWADYRHLLETGHAGTARIWKRGEQLTGDEPLTRDALRDKLRWALVALRERTEARIRADSEGNGV